MTTLPNNSPITNIASMGFQYLVDPTSVPVSAAILTNDVGTIINVAYIDLVKYASPSYVKVNDEITYTFVLNNIGNVLASNVVLIDTIPNGTTLVPSSVYLDNVLISNSNPSSPNGIDLGTIPNGVTSTLQFKVIVNTIPTPNPVINNSTVLFKYTVDPSVPNGKSTGNTSNSTSTQFNQAIIDNAFGGGLIKTASKKYAKVNDILTYNISLKNTGNTTANDIILIDTIPDGTSFVSDSLRLNGVTLTGSSPINPGFQFGALASGEVSTVSFNIKVDTIPSPNPIKNNASLYFVYTVDPSVPNGVNDYGTSNLESTQINQANIDNGYGNGFNKYSSPAYVKIGDTITYTLTLKNTGNVQATNLVLTDTPPAGTTFINNSVVVNGITVPGASPTAIGISPIAAGALSTVQFKVKVDTIPTINPIPNISSLAFKFTVNPSTPNDTNNSGASNIVYNQVNQAIIDNGFGNGLVETVDNPYGKVGDILTYTVSLRNTGNVTANNIIFTNTIASSTTLISDSILVDGVQTSNLGTIGNLSININSIAVNAISTVQFKVTINTIPSNNTVQNSSSISFKYSVDPSVPNGVTGYGNSNIVSTKISQAIIDNSIGGGFVKSADVAYAKPGDTITYRVALKNTGNVAANNVLFVDTVPIGSSLVPNSILLNGITQTDTIPVIKVNVGSISSNTTSTIQFKVLVNFIPTVNPMPNNASVDFSFTVDPSIPNGVNYGGNSDTTNVDIRQAIIDNANGNGLIKYVNTANATVGDTLTYTISLKNTGNTSANNVLFFDTIPDGSTFVANSVVVNNITIPNANPSSATGVNVGNISSNSTTTVSFKVNIINTTNNSPILNSSRVKFNYTVNPSNPNAITGYGNSNATSTNVNIAIIDGTNESIFNELSNPYFVSTKNLINYTLRLRNSGTVTANNVVLLCTIPNGTSFVPNSLSLNNSVVTGATPEYPLGFTIGSISAGNLSTVTFRVLVDTIPVPNLIEHSSTLKYDYLVDPSIPRTISTGANSNSSFNKVNEAIINNIDGGLNKYVNLNNARVGETLTYTIRAFNIGNVSANNLVLKDTIPEGTTFVQDSVSINGNIVPSLNPASSTGINLGILPSSTGITVSFKAVITSVPYTNPIPNTASVMFRYLLDPSTLNSVMGYGSSNEVTTQINQASIDFRNGGFNNILSNYYVKLGDNITDTFVLKNTGNITANNVILTTTVPVGASLVINSVTLNGNLLTNPNFYAPTGINIGDMDPNAVCTVTYDMVVISLPPSGELATSATVKFTHVIDPSVPAGQPGGGNSNIAKAKVSDAIIDSNAGVFTKQVSPSYVKLLDTVTYTFGVKNTGNVIANNILLKDTIPNGLSFVSGSLSINGSSINLVSIPSNGINIGSISASTTSTVQFKAIVSTIPTINPLTNTGYVNFSYTVNPSIPNGVIGNGVSNSAYTAFRQAIIDKAFTDSFITTVSSNYSKIADELTYTIALRNIGNVTANNVILRNTIPNATAFVPNSLLVNDSSQSESISSNILNVNLGNLISGAVATIKYTLIVTTIPTGNIISNTPIAIFNYINDPSLPNIQSGGLSNTVSVRVNQAMISNTKTVSPAFADIGDVLTYNLLLQNRGNTSATNVVVFDTIVNDLSFVLNSVLVNGTSIPNADLNPPIGLNIGTIPAGNTSIVSFNVSVSTIPAINPTENSSTVKFNFTVDPSLPNAADGSGNSNITSTKINRAVIDCANGLTQYINKNFCTVNDTLEYTIVLKNTGSIDATNIFLAETFPSGATFVTGSVAINGTTIPLSNPTSGNGINVGSIAPNNTSTVTFKVKVNSIPNNNKIETNAKVKFNYKVNPSLSTLSNGSGASNITSCTVNAAIINNLNGIFTEGVSPIYSIIDGIITYSFNITNTGNVTAYNLRLIDTLPNGLEFLANSVMVNNLPLTGVVPDSSTGISLNTLDAGVSLSVQFKARITGMPTPNPVSDNSIVTFNYLYDPDLDMIEGSGESSFAILTIKDATIDYNKGGGFVKSVDSAYSTIGEIITYNLTLKNTGNTNANNILLIDTIPDGLSFIDNSVFINGFPKLGMNPSPGYGISIDVVPPNVEVPVSFSVMVDTIPSINPVQNDASIEFYYTADPSLPNGIISSGNSNTIETMILIATIDNFNVSASKNYVKLGDIISYTISLPNTGNTTANNIMLTGTIPNGTILVRNSVYVDGINKPDVSPDPDYGISIGSIDATSSSTVTFDVLVVSIPSVNPMPLSTTVNFDFILDPSIPTSKSSSGNSITAYTQLNAAIIDNLASDSFKKQAVPKYAKINDTINYSLLLKNVGNQSANNVVVVDTIPKGMKFVNGSLVVNGISYPTASIAPPAGLPIGSITPSEAVTITFKTLVITLPSPNPAPNYASVKFLYTVDPEAPTPTIGGGNSNASLVSVREAVIDKNRGFTKTVDKSLLAIKDKLTYTLTLTNTGNVDANNVLLTDDIPYGLNIVPNTLKLNGNNISDDISSNAGINLGVIGSGSTATVVFNAVVTSIPNPNIAENKAKVTFTYTVDPSLPNNEFRQGTSNKVSSTINSVDFGTASGALVLTSDKSLIKIKDVITYTAVINNLGNISAHNVIFTNTIPVGAEFVPYSVLVDGLNNITLNPASGINLGTINPNTAITISFKVQGVSIPENEAVISNEFIVDYDYYLDPLSTTPIKGQDVSNNVKNPISAADISNPTGGFELSSDKQVVLVGDTLTYTIKLKNNGNLLAYDVTLYSTIPKEAELIPGSVFIDTIPSNDTPETGIFIGEIAPKHEKTVTFSLNIRDLPPDGIINSDGTVTYSYNSALLQSGSINNSLQPKSFEVQRISPQAITTFVTSLSNLLKIRVVSIKFNKAHTVDKKYADIGDTLEYKIFFENSCNVDLENIIIKDSLPDGTTFIPNSFTINDVLIPTINPSLSYNIGNLAIGESIVLGLKVSVVSIPKAATVQNSLILNFTYYLDPVTIASNSNILSTNNISINSILGSDSIIFDSDITNINTAYIGGNGLVLTSDKPYVSDNDIVTYSLLVNNIGTVAAQNIILSTTIPEGMELIPGSVSIDNNGYPSVNPIVGISLGTLAPFTPTTITYKTKVLTNLKVNELPSEAYINYGYVVDPSSDIKLVSNTSNLYNTIYKKSNLIINKTADKTKANLNSPITYTLTIKNIGNTTAENVLIKDLLDPALSFMPGTILINGVPYTGLDITQGIDLSKIPPNSEIVITFKALVTSPGAGYLLSSTTNADYNFEVDPNKPLASGNSESNANNVMSLIYLNRNKQIPCNPLCQNAEICDIICTNVPMCCCSTLRSKVYSVEDLCTALECISSGIDIKKYKMWSENSINTTMVLNDPRIIKIQCISAKLDLIRTSTVDTPVSTNSNLEGKILSGKMKVVDTLITFTVTYLNNRGQTTKKKCCKIFSNSIIMNKDYFDTSLKIKGVIEDISITDFSNSTLSLSATTLVYLVKSTDSDQNLIPRLTCITSGMDNFNICKDKAHFLSKDDYLWSTTTAYTTDNICSRDYVGIYSTNAKIEILSTTKLNSVAASSTHNNEGLNSTGKELLVNMLLLVSVNFTANIGTQYIVIPCEAYINIPQSHLPSDSYSIDTCIENLYVGTIGTTIFTNANIVVKAKQIREF